jgi:hypothetical protein
MLVVVVDEAQRIVPESLGCLEGGEDERMVPRLIAQ